MRRKTKVVLPGACRGSARRLVDTCPGLVRMPQKTQDQREVGAREHMQINAQRRQRNVAKGDRLFEELTVG